MTTFSPIEEHFPGAVSDDRFLVDTLGELRTKGFAPGDAVACIAACRDMARHPLLDGIREAWPMTYDFAALAAVPTVGDTGGRILAHAASQIPRRTTQPQVVCFVLPHLALDEGCAGCFTLERLLAQLHDGCEWGEEAAADAELVRLRKRVWLRCDNRHHDIGIEQLAKMVLDVACLAAEGILDSARRQGARCELVAGLLIETSAGTRVWSPPTHAESSASVAASSLRA